MRHTFHTAVLACAIAAPLAAEPIATIETGPQVALPEGYAVLDIRDEDTCFAGAPPNSRCLPAEQLPEAESSEPQGAAENRHLVIP